MTQDQCPKCDAPLTLDDLVCSKCGTAVRRQRRLGEILVDEGIISRESLDKALKLQKSKLGEILVELGACKPEDLERAVQLQRLGRTRADIYRTYLRAALVAILCLVVTLTLVLLRLEQHAQLMVQIEKESLSIDEVDKILEDPKAPYKFEALRSLSHHLADPRALVLLDRALRHEKWYIQLYATVLAKQSRSKTVVPALIALLVDDTKVLAPLAHQALEAISGQTLEPTLKAWKGWAQANGIVVDLKRAAKP